MRHLCLIIMLLPIILSSINVDVSVNKYTVSTADQLELTLKISGSEHLRVSEPAPPQISLFSFRNLTSSSSSSVAYSGTKLSAQYSHTYRFIYFPKKPGTTKVPSFSVTVNNRSFRTREIPLTVIQGQNKQPGQNTPSVPGYNPFSFSEPDYWEDSSGLNGDTRLLAVPETQTVYRGFPAIVSYYLYTDSMVRSFNLEDEKDFRGYGKSTYEQPSMLNYENVKQNGKSYKRALIKRLAIIPNTQGSLQAPVLEGIARMFSYGYSDLQLSSQPATISVRPLPQEGIPMGFSGAVGNFQLSHSLSKRELGLGEALTFTLKIQGRGNFNQFSAPQFESEKGFQVSAPMVIDNLSAGIEGTRTYYYTLIPQSKGEFSLPELKFAWFAHDQKRYQSYRSPNDKIMVSSTPVLSYLNRLWEPRNLRSIYPKLMRKNYPDYKALASQTWYWLLIITIGAGTAVAVFFAMERKLKYRNPESYSQKKADKILKRYMKQALAASRELSEDFYPLSEKALFDYLAAKYKLARHLSLSEVLAALHREDIPQILLDELQDFLNRSTAARFKPKDDRAITLSTDVEILKRVVRNFAALQKNHPERGKHE